MKPQTSPDMKSGKETKSMASKTLHDKVMMADFAQTFESFKDANDDRLAQIEAKSSADSLTEQKVARIDAALPWAAKPKIICLDIPAFDSGDRSGPLVGVMLSPFNRAEIISGNHSVVVTEPVIAGTVQTPFDLGPIGRFDLGTSFEFTLSSGEFSAVSDTDLLSGENRFAVETRAGWEILQMGEIELIGENRHRASRLLRGLAGTDVDMSDIRTGAQIIGLGQGLTELAVPQERGEAVTLTAIAAGRAANPLSLAYQARHLRPLSPVHAKAVRSDMALAVSWIRRARTSGDSWAGLDVPLGEDISLFRVEAIKNGAVVETVETNVSAAVLQTLDADSLEIVQGSTAYGFGAALRLSL